ncbi:MAG: acetyl-CoA carboxylase, carboxyltransferase subunit beta [Candidatus Ratteibacteria bacterium]|nr:acetyl-CoA carboxylase, carboxyltransferase subunit beta [Candidatus Ratteibacteria bacterium]
MAWKRSVEYILKPKKRKGIPEGLWSKCPACSRILYTEQLLKNLKVCPKCDYHFRLSAKERLAQLLEEDTFEEMDANLESVDPLKFEDSQKYPQRVREAQEKTGLKEAVVTGEGKIGEYKAAVGFFDFPFLGGSMASVVGEKICRLIEKATEKELPLVIVSASGGARMQEGILSLMQMAKTSAALSFYSKKALPYISILTDPTTGGVSASFAFLADIIIAEPGALIGFAGPRVIEQTVRQKLPEKFQKAEFLLEHGMMDMVIHRKNLKITLLKIFKLFKIKPAVSVTKDEAERGNSSSVIMDKTTSKSGNANGK